MASTPPITGVKCERCGAPIAVKAVERLTEEFAVTCPKCGHRAFYRIADLKNIQPR
jgi:DNA-directed RNA polymerase subunit RPC12/RpoP